MTRLALLLPVGVALAACRTLAPVPAAGPLVDEGAIYLYVQPFPASAARLSLALESVAAVTAEGALVPLGLELSDLSGRDTTSQRLLARGRLPPGRYAGFSVKARSATLTTPEGRADLLVGEPLRVEAPFGLAAGAIAVRWLALEGERAVSGVAFTPAFAVVEPALPNPQVLGMVTGEGEEAVVVFDRVRREVVSVLPTGREPRGLALGARLGRVHVALAGRDELQALDLTTGADMGRVRLRPGDEPGDVALTRDGRLLVVANRGSATVSFVDPDDALEVSRAAVGEEPGRILLDRSGRRAYVLNTRSSTVTALELGAAPAAVATAATDAEPLMAALNRAGTRLYVVHGGSPYLAVLSLPDLALTSRVFVGIGARTIEVDTRTDLIFVGNANDNQLQIFDPFSFVQVGRIVLPDAPGEMAIDDAQNLLLALLPSRGSIAFVDLTTRQTVGLVDVGPAPQRLVLTGERR